MVGVNFKNNLKPCPFCGNEKGSEYPFHPYKKSLYLNRYHHEYGCPPDIFVECQACWARGPSKPYGSNIDAIELWNLRDKKFDKATEEK